MATSSDDTPPTNAALRIGGWLPDSRQPARPPAPDPDPVQGRWHQVAPAPSRQTTPPPAPTSRKSPDRSARTLMLGCLAVGVAAMLVFALVPLWSGAPRPEQEATAFVPAPGGFAQDPAPDPVSATEEAGSSPAPVSLSTRATLPSPTQVAPPAR
ncbi:hypothetical protein E1182_00475, partial [Micromonospora sp. KC721]